MTYYYLIAGLPDLVLDQSSPDIDVEDILANIRRNLESEDEQLFRYLLYPNDNRNLLNVLFHQYKGFAQNAFCEPAVLSETVIAEYQKHLEEMPLYMVEFLQDYQNQFKDMSLLAMEDRLWQKIDLAIKKQGSILPGYFDFTRQLREYMAWQNVKHFHFLGDPFLYANTSLNRLGQRHFAISESFKKLPYFEQLEQVIGSGDPNQIEQSIDQIKWGYLSQISGFFNRDQVYVYVLKLLILNRWQRLNEETGENRFKAIQENIKLHARSPLIQVL